jgi:hypothetical protein
VTVTDSPAPAAWDAFVSAHRDATGYHLWGWRTVFRDALGHDCVYLAALRGDTIVGILPIVAFDTWLFGRFGVSLPFVNYGGVVAQDDEAARALVDQAARIAEARRWKHLEIRHLDQRFPDLAPKRHKVAMYRPLAADEGKQWEQVDRKVRNQIRKAQKSGFVSALGGVELLDDYYAVFARNMRDLGTPVYAPSFFQAILEAFPERARLHVIRTGATAESPAGEGKLAAVEKPAGGGKGKSAAGMPATETRSAAGAAPAVSGKPSSDVATDGKPTVADIPHDPPGTPVAASLTFAWRDLVEVPWASSLKEYRSQCPNMLLYWEMLRTAVADGHRTFDFGRSTPDEGTFQFKRQWGAEPRPMCWEYWLPAGQSLPDQSPKNAKFAAAISLWQRLPLAVANRLGPPIVRGIP